MLNIDLLQDEGLQDVVKVFLSSLLPHENFDPSFFSENLQMLLKFIHLEEFTMEYRLLVSAVNSLNSLYVSFDGYEPRLYRSTFQSLVEVSLPENVIDPEYGVEDWLKYNGCNSNLKIETVKEEACQKLYSRGMELYDECFALAVPSSDAVNHRPELKAAFIAHTGVQCVNLQSLIIRDEARVGRKRLRGYNDWLSYTKEMTVEIDSRLDDTDDGVLCLDSIEHSNVLLEQLQDLKVPIANYGIPEIDDYTPILRHRLVVVVGKENIGKTKFAIDQAVNVMLEGHTVAYMCGESPKSLVYADMIINYVYKKFGLILRQEHVAHPELCPKDVKAAVGMAVDDLVGEKKLVLCESFDYGTVYDELRVLYEKYKFDFCAVDHSCALQGKAGDGSLRSNVEALSTAALAFKRKYPVCLMVLSHPSTTAKESDNKGNATVDSPTKGAQKLSGDADEVFYIRDNPSLRKQNLVIFENTKRRGAARLTDYVMLRKRFDVNAYVYDPYAQSIDNELTIDKQEALRCLEEAYGDDEEYTL